MVVLKHLPEPCCSAASTALTPTHMLCHVFVEDISFLQIYDAFCMLENTLC